MRPRIATKRARHCLGVALRREGVELPIEEAKARGGIRSPPTRCAQRKARKLRRILLRPVYEGTDGAMFSAGRAIPQPPDIRGGHMAIAEAAED